MKKILFLLFLSCAKLSVVAQSGPPNASFENWTELITTNPNNYLGSNDIYFMTEQMSNMFGGDISIATSVTRVAPGQAGSYAIKVSNVMMVDNEDSENNELLAGFVLNTSNTSISDLENPEASMGTAYTARPATMKGYYKFNQGSTTTTTKDTAIVGAWLTRWNTTTEDRDTIGYSVLEVTETQTSFTEFNIPFEYSNTDAPDTLFFVIFSSLNEELQSEDTYIIVDNITFEDAVTSVARPIYRGEEAPQVFPNPTTENSAIRAIPLNAVKITVSNSQGIQVWSAGVENRADAVVPSQNFDNGMYLITYWDKEDQSLMTQKLVVSK